MNLTANIGSGNTLSTNISNESGVDAKFVGDNDLAAIAKDGGLIAALPEWSDDSTKDVVKIAIFGDSLPTSGLSGYNAGTDQPLSYLAYTGTFARKLYDYLSCPKPAFVRYNDVSVTIVGTYTPVLSNYPKTVGYPSDLYAELDDAGVDNTVTIVGITNATFIHLVFEGEEESGTPSGAVEIEIDDGGGYDYPSVKGIRGEKVAANSDLFPTWSFEDSWWDMTCISVTTNTFTTGAANNRGVRINNGDNLLIIGEEYEITISGSTTDGTVKIGDPSRTYLYGSGFGTHTFTPQARGLYLYLDKSNETATFTSLILKKKKYDGFDYPLDTFHTTYRHDGTPVAIGKHCPQREACYSGLDPSKTYNIRITRSKTQNNVRYWGLYYGNRKNGQYAMIVNRAVAGANWSYLEDCVYQGLEMPGIDAIWLLAPMYHDLILSTAQSDAESLIDKIAGYGINIAIMSSSPGGVVLEGDFADQNFVYEFNRQIWFNCDLLIIADVPIRGDTYSGTVGGSSYTFTCFTPIARTAQATRVYFYVADENYPHGYESYPMTLTKILGGGANAINCTSLRREIYTMSAHRNLVQTICSNKGVTFLDVYNHFNDIAIAAGETLETDGHSIDPGTDLYNALIAAGKTPAEIAAMSGNNMSLYFDWDDGHHYTQYAHIPIYELMRDNFL